MVCNLKEITHLLNIIRYPLWQSDMSCGLFISVSSVSYRQKRGSDFPFVQAVDGIRYTDEEYNQLLADPVSAFIISNTHWLKSLVASSLLQAALNTWLAD